MNDKEVSYQDLLVRCENLEKDVIKSIRTERELSISKNEKDEALDRLESIQLYSNRSLLASNLKEFADNTVEFVATAFELENSLFFVYNNSGKCYNLLSHTGLDEDIAAEIDFELSWISSHNIQADPKVFIKKIDAESKELMNLGLYRVIIAPIVNEEKQLIGMVIGGVTTSKKLYFTEIDEKLLPIFSVFSQQMNALIQNLEIKRLLEEKVQRRTARIENQKKEIQEKSLTLEHQNNQITDSIQYAQKIQSAVLQTEELLTGAMPEHFILFKPRDIVSGDFYWIKEIKNYIIVVAADCTGHGVPGAFMSMLGIAFLNELVGKTRIDRPGEILNKLRKKVKKTLSQEGKLYEQKDGMDIALAIIDKENMELQFSGAFNSLYLVDEGLQQRKEIEEFFSMENGGFRLYDFKGDRQPIGIYMDELDFTSKNIKLKKNDKIYLFSDGFADQVGGPKGKKYMTKRFKQTLLDVQRLSITDQKEALNNILEEWRGEYEQVDDILVLGLRV